MDTISGIPAHPLFVHLPVVLIPLTAFGVVIMMIRKAWYFRYRWAVLFTGGLAAVGALLAGESGESLESSIRASGGEAAAQAVHDHVEAGDLARIAGVLFFLALLAYILVPRYLARRAGTDERETPLRPSWLGPTLKVVVVVMAAFAVFTVVGAGHSGAESVWKGESVDSD